MSLKVESFDHIAIAVEHWRDAWALYARDLGGRWDNGNEARGFAPSRLRFASGVLLEVLAPNRVEEDAFLRRFLDNRGPGVHHLTFYVEELEDTFEELRQRGISWVGSRESFESTGLWREAFLKPPDAMGTLIQLVETDHRETRRPVPSDFPEPRQTADLDHIGHVVSTLGAGTLLYGDLLGGEKVSEGRTEASQWVDFVWRDRERIRVHEPIAGSELARWLGNRQGAINYICFRCESPELPSESTKGTDGYFHVSASNANAVNLRLMYAEGGSA